MIYPTVIKYIPEEYTQYLVQYHKENKHTYDIFDWEEDELYLRMWGLTEKSKVSGRAHAANSILGTDDPDGADTDPRWGGRLRNDFEFSSIIEKILNLFNVEYTEFEAYIKTSYLPISLHVDAEIYESDEKLALDQSQTGEDARLGCSIIIPLTFNKNIHTIIFNNMVEENDLVRNFLEKIAGVWESYQHRQDNYRADLPIYEHNLDYRNYIPNIWNNQMISYHLDPENNEYARGDQVLDYLEVDEIIPWEENVAYMFHKQKMHMSNNFKKFGVETKDFILIHTH